MTALPLERTVEALAKEEQMSTLEAVVVDTDLGPLERKLRVAYVSAVLFDEPVDLKVGDLLTLRDVDGSLTIATVSEIESGAYGLRYRVKF